MAILPNAELADLLEWAAGRVRAGDSFDGHIQWTYTDDPGNRVSAAVQYDNLNGQGCMRLIEDDELDEPADSACRACGSAISEGRTHCGSLECGQGELP